MSHNDLISAQTFDNYYAASLGVSSAEFQRAVLHVGTMLESCNMLTFDDVDALFSVYDDKNPAYGDGKSVGMHEGNICVGAKIGTFIHDFCLIDDLISNHLVYYMHDSGSVKYHVARELFDTEASTRSA